MSFSHTTEQMRAGTKDITRRTGWSWLRPGDRVRAVEKTMGLKKGERVKPIAEIEIVSTRSESIGAVTQEDVIREGFPEMSREEFVRLLCKITKSKDDTRKVNRIEYRFIRHF